MARTKDELVAGVADRFLGTLQLLRTLSLRRHGAESWLTLELTMGQLKALMALVATGGLPAGELAQHLGVAPSAVTALVDRLCAQGLARREADDEDRRVTWIRPSDEGIALRERLVSTGRDGMVDLLGDLTVRDLEGLERALAALARAADRRLPPGADRGDGQEVRA